LRANFFGLRVVNPWHRLPAEIVEALSVNCSTGRFDRFTGGNKSSSEWNIALENCLTKRHCLKISQQAVCPYDCMMMWMVVMMMMIAL
jgi:hypothetical protein